MLQIPLSIPFNSACVYFTWKYRQALLLKYPAYFFYFELLKPTFCVGTQVACILTLLWNARRLLEYMSLFWSYLTSCWKPGFCVVLRRFLLVLRVFIFLRVLKMYWAKKNLLFRQMFGTTIYLCNMLFVSE